MSETNPSEGPSQAGAILRVQGLDEPVSIARDAFGVAHIRAATEHDAWFGQGFASAEDRAWQMEYDRRRATGRWAEVAGPAALAGDRLSRRLQLARAAKADVAAMSNDTRAMFDAYAAGVNAFLESGRPLAVEYGLSDINPERWEPWHSVAAFKIRHVLMGQWQRKLAMARLLALIGPGAMTRLDDRSPAGSPVILPPGGSVADLYERSAAELAEAAEQLGFLSEVGAGSNSWAVHGSRTTTGMPVLCNDSHRALDVPNVYWQAHVTCPEFDVIGATFPGVPAFPHFGHNGRVAWNITHTHADYQDLYIEQFDPRRPGRYRVPGGWADAEHGEETIAVRGAEPAKLDIWRTRHGPIVHGDPRRGPALSLRYTATDGPTRGFEALRLMLKAATVAELHEAQRDWVDPVNNLVSADVSGNIGYLTRGYLPVRSSEAHRSLPAPGWTGEHEWVGRVPFEELPQAINPPEGFIVTANQRVIAGETPYISDFFAPPARAERIREELTARARLAVEDVVALQADVMSLPARAWIGLFERVGPLTGEAEQARTALAVWDGNLVPAAGKALLYACLRRVLARALFAPIVGPDVWRWLASATLPPTSTMISHWMANVVAGLGDRYAVAAPDERPWEHVLPGVLAEAWAAACQWGGPDPAAWSWGALHRTNARHTLSATTPEPAMSLDPPRVSIGGDGDTIQVGSYSWAESAAFDVTSLSVYRQAVDLADISHASFIVPGGVSGSFDSAHFADQVELWQRHQRIPMHFTEKDVQGATVSTLVLAPSAR